MDRRYDLGIYGLGIIGSNLAHNFLEKGFGLAAYNRGESHRRAFSEETTLYPRVFLAPTEAAFIASLSLPRVVLLTITAGKAVDEALERLIPLLDAGDILVDAGDSYFRDTERRVKLAADHALRFIGLGISGGAEGARSGPSLMAGGAPEAWPRLKPLLEAIAATTPSGEPCCDWIGPGGAGHFVKTAHNAIEYADMELIAEAYHLLRSTLRTSHDEMRMIFADWGRTELESYLLEITVDILGVREEDGEPLLDKVLDRGEQGGTGAWAVEAALELGIPVGILAESVFARHLSSLKDERMSASAVLMGPSAHPTGDRKTMIEEIRRAFLAAKTLAYTEVFLLLRRASEEWGWNLDFGRVARLWRAGSIIRSPFIDSLAEAYRRDPDLLSPLLDTQIQSGLDQNLASLRRVVARSIDAGIPVPTLAAALSFYDGYRSTWLPANLLQALRDRFGGHGYERVDRPRGEIYHSEWR